MSLAAISHVFDILLPRLPGSLPPQYLSVAGCIGCVTSLILYTVVQVFTTPTGVGAIIVFFMTSRACTVLGQLLFMDSKALSRPRSVLPYAVSNGRKSVIRSTRTSSAQPTPSKPKTKQVS